MPERHPELRALERLVARRRAEVIKDGQRAIDVAEVGIGELREARSSNLDRVLCEDRSQVELAQARGTAGTARGHTVVLRPLLLHLLGLGCRQVGLLEDERRVGDLVEEADPDLRRRSKGRRISRGSVSRGLAKTHPVNLDHPSQ